MLQLHERLTRLVYILSLLLACQAIVAEQAAPSAKAFQAAAEYSEAHAGSATLVMHDGKILFQRYAQQTDEKTAHHLHSGTKGFWGPVVAAMIQDELIESFDEPASKTICEWQKHPRKKMITIRHLLQLNAGLAQDIQKLQGHDRETLAHDLYAHAKTLPVRFEPGEEFMYGPSCYYALGAVLKEKLAERKQTPLDYLKQRILEPIGVKIGHWVHDESGNPHIPNGASLTARDWARYGQFLLQEGKWGDKQLIKAELMRELREPSKANPGHGLAIWLNTPGGFTFGRFGPKSAQDDPGGFIYPHGEPELFAALGAGKNRMYLVPSRKLVIVRNCEQRRDRFNDGEFLKILLDSE